MPSSLVKPAVQIRGPKEISYILEANSQTFKKGDPVILSSNKVAIAVASGSNLDSTGTRILGVAKTDGQNGTSLTRRIPVFVAQPGAQILLPYWSATAADSEQQDQEIGFECVLRNVGGIFVANLDTTSNPVLKLAEKLPQSATERFGLAWWTILKPAFGSN
jgi:hypothetical protein